MDDRAKKCGPCHLPVMTRKAAVGIQSDCSRTRVVQSYDRFSFFSKKNSFELLDPTHEDTKDKCKNDANYFQTTWRKWNWTKTRVKMPYDGNKNARMTRIIFKPHDANETGLRREWRCAMMGTKMQEWRKLFSNHMTRMKLDQDASQDAPWRGQKCKNDANYFQTIWREWN